MNLSAGSTARRSGLWWHETLQPGAGGGNAEAGVKAPAGLTLNATTLSAMWSATNTNLPLGSASSDTTEAKPAVELASGNGEPEMGVSAPFAEMENAETVLRSEAVESGKLLAYSTVPPEFTERPKGLAAGNGDPETGASTPFAPIEKTAMLLEAWFAANTKRPAASAATAVGRVPVGKGDPATGVRAPVDVLTENSDSVFAL